MLVLFERFVWDLGLRDRMNFATLTSIFRRYIYMCDHVKRKPHNTEHFNGAKKNFIQLNALNLESM